MTTTAATEVKERPVLFSGPMVKAILEGRKTQTRRVVKPQPPKEAGLGLTVNTYSEPDYYQALFFRGPTVESTGMGRPVKCPYGKPGDRLWCRETWRPQHPYDLPGQEKPIYAADWTPEEFEQIYGKTWGWKPSIFMPRFASRITLEVVNVRVERLQDISEADCVAEGIEDIGAGDLRGMFAVFWSSINDKRGYGWASNPWVWVVEFKKIEE
jgi:hypothetical protein